MSRRSHPLITLVVVASMTLATLPGVRAQGTGYGAVPHALPATPFDPLMRSWMNLQWMSNLASHFMGPMVDEATRFKVLDAMMRAMNPAILLGASAAGGQAPFVRIPGFPTQSASDLPPNTVSDSLSAEAKRSFYQAMMLMSPLSMRDMIAIMADKRAVAEGVSFEDAVDSMKLRANERNFKLVGHSPLWLDVKAISGDEDTPRVEIFQFCDAMVARRILDYVPEFVVFLPCRIALLEDAEGKLWVMTLDWDVNWLDYAQNPNSRLDSELRAEAQRIRSAMHYIMEGAATGDF